MALQFSSHFRQLTTSVRSTLFGDKVSEDRFFSLLAEATQRRGAYWHVDEGGKIRTTINGQLYDPIIFAAYDCHPDGKIPTAWMQAARIIGMPMRSACDIGFASDRVRSIERYACLRGRLLDSLGLPADP